MAAAGFTVDPTFSPKTVSQSTLEIQAQFNVDGAVYAQASTLPLPTATHLSLSSQAHLFSKAFKARLHSCPAMMRFHTAMPSG
jgi:hypothetical protein